MIKGLKITLFVGILVLVLPVLVSAAQNDEGVKFFVDPSYDLKGRPEITALLSHLTPNAYFYIDDDWWKSLDYQKKEEVEQALSSLSSEFYYKIYPTLTSTFSSEWKPGIDKDNRITILIHPMKGEAGGYFNNGDEYPRLQNPKSNEREMVYLNADYIASSLAKSFLAHEFTHLITFNQKEKIHGVKEEVWLNEARAEYAPTLVGYDSEYEGSNLEKRVKIFLEEPSDPITEWLGEEADYGSLNLFTQYLVERYGIEILADSLKSENTGIKSLNYALEKNGFEEDFSQIFTNWTITVLANDCSLGEKYCYQNENLKNLQITPSINFLPLRGKSTLGVNQTTKNWSGNWFKFIGGKEGTLKIEFIGNPENLFKVPYLSKNISGEYSLDFFQLNEYQRGRILVSDFGTKIDSVTIIPTIQSKISGFLSPELAFPFFWEASTIVGIEEVEEDSNSKYLGKPISKMTKEEILTTISEIEELLSQLKERLDNLNAPEEISCQNFDQNLYYGLRNDDRVRCLQEFLKSQGSEIYPEGLVTGNFLSLTKAAVIRFQERYAEEILAPWDLTEGTGFVGETTRAKINEMLNK
jgi:hypothetical protein